MMRKCFYEILDVDKNASTEEIKKAYKKMALVHHPDKNQDNDEAKELFQEINEAYKILSDPNERSWYDNHRNQILTQKEKFSEEDAEIEHFGRKIKKFFRKDCYETYDDSEKGFFKIYRDLFQYISMKEQEAAEEKENENFLKPPGFGDMNTDIEFVEKFYDYWESFITYKSFSYADYWKLTEGESREIRRLMEKENKKYREAEKKEYIKTVRTLIDFVKKKDPRYKKVIAHHKEEARRKEALRKQKEEEKKALKKERLKRARIEEQKRYEETAHINPEEEIIENLVEDEFYCSVCNKSFKSDKQLINHEKSKIHQKNVNEIRKQVADYKELSAFEEEKFEKQEKKEEEKEVKISSEKKLSKKQKKKMKEIEARINPTPDIQEEEEEVQANGKEESEEIEESEEEVDFTKLIAKSKKKEEFEVIKVEAKEEEKNTEEKEEAPKKIGKAKAKREKKKEVEEKLGKDFKMCNVCGLKFPSKTKLFSHLKEKGHAAVK